MKSYNTLEECLLHKSSKDFIFKQTIRNKQYSIGSLESILKFQKKLKSNLYEYVDFNKPLKLYFYIYSETHHFEDIFVHTINILKLNKNDFIVVQENDMIYRIIHKYYYFDSFKDLDNYLFTFNLFNVSLNQKNFLPSLLNTDIILFDKYDFNDSIINNTISLLKIPININIKTCIYTQKYINTIDFENYNTLFIKSGMGSGKSTTAVKYIKNNNIGNFLILSCRRTLTYTIYDKLKENDIEVTNYLTTKKENIKLCNKLIISPDSIYKLDYPLKKYDFIWIDEGVSFMYYIGSHLLVDKNNKNNAITVLEWLLINCKRLLITDADLNQSVIDFYLYYRSIRYCKLLKYNNSSYIKYNLFDDENNILKNLEENLKNNKNIYICCDTLTKTKHMYEYIIKLNLNIKILLYNSESEYTIEKKMYDVNKFWSSYNVVIVSPKVVFGVDFSIKHFDYVYGFYKCTTLNVREAFQQLHRIRCINIINVYIYEKTDLELDNTLQLIKYNIQMNKIDKLFYKKSKQEIDFILNMFEYNITSSGYRYINMNNALNYLLIYSLYEKNNSLNNFIDLFKNILVT